MTTKRRLRKDSNPLTCKHCKESKPADKHYPYCSQEHWTKAVNEP